MGATDPFWAILTDPKKKNRGWDAGEFFSTGGPEVAGVLARVEQLHPLRRGRALDFGCGVGRLTQPLSEQFSEACGVDISPSMIELARKHNRNQGRCQYFLNSKGDLSIFPERHFDFIYSSITLQHIRPQFAKRYLEEFVRVLAPGGVLVFQLPSKQVEGAVTRMQQIMHAAYYRVVRPLLPFAEPVIEMHGIEKPDVVKLLESRGAKILEISPDGSAGPVWESYRYMATRE